MNVILMGPPGSGKGTQAAALAGRHGLQHVSTGELLRAAVASGSELGRRVAGILAAGELVPDEVMMQVVRERLRDAAGGWLLDGFPRTVPQADGLAALLAELDAADATVVLLEVPDAEIVKRLAGRLTCADCGRVTSRADAAPAGGAPRCPGCCGGRLEVRADDREETVRNRLAVYRAKTVPAAEALGRRFPLRRVDGRGSPAEVAQRIASAVAPAHQA